MEASDTADVKCGKLEGNTRRYCQSDEIPRDCTESDNKARCEAEVAAHKACRGDVAAYRGCMDGKLKK